MVQNFSWMVYVENGNMRVKIEPASQMHAVMQLLNGNGLECEIAEGMYQG
jgi:hypothetical protein